MFMVSIPETISKLKAIWKISDHAGHVANFHDEGANSPSSLSLYIRLRTQIMLHCEYQYELAGTRGECGIARVKKTIEDHGRWLRLAERHMPYGLIDMNRPVFRYRQQLSLMPIGHIPLPIESCRYPVRFMTGEPYIKNQ
jgi:hypothetical protein